MLSSYGLSSYRYLGSCGTLPREFTQSLVDSAREISYDTFYRNVGIAAIQATESSWGHKFTLKEMKEYQNDFRFYKSKFRGHWFYFFQHSAIEYVYGDVDQIAERRTL